MVAQLEQVPHEAEDTEVSSCVLNLIQAFTNGLNIFKRLRERRRKRSKASKEDRAADRAIDAELQLSESLRKGPKELAQRYTEYRAGIGRNFAKGDAIAHASLAETLIKLNTGLINIISTFLDRKDGKNHLHLDYRSLTNLSDISRREALHSMTQLYERLSQSQLQIHTISPSNCQCCGDSRHATCSDTSASPSKKKRKHKSLRQRVDGPVVTKMPIKSSSEPKLVVVRPKNKRKSSTTSKSSSTKSGTSTTNTSPLASPLPRFVPVDPFEVQVASPKTSPKASPKASPRIGAETGRQRVDSFNDQRPTTWPHTHVAPAPEYNHNPVPKLPNFIVVPRKPVPASPSRSKPSSPPPAIPPYVKRRLDKATPSSYTFASDSTKLGEIPQRHWTTPWDYEEAERLNTLARETGDPIAVAAAEKAGKKKGLFGFLRRGSSAGVAP